MPPGVCILLQHKGPEPCEEMKAVQKQREGGKEQMMKRRGAKPAVGTEEEAEGDGGVSANQHICL